MVVFFKKTVRITKQPLQCTCCSRARNGKGVVAHAATPFFLDFRQG